MLKLERRIHYPPSTQPHPSPQPSSQSRRTGPVGNRPATTIRWIVALAFIVFATIAAGCSSAGQQQAENIELSDDAKDALRAIRDITKEAVSDLEDLNDRAEDDDDISNRDPIFDSIRRWIEVGKDIITTTNNPTTCLGTLRRLDGQYWSSEGARNELGTRLERADYPVYLKSHYRGIREVWLDGDRKRVIFRSSDSCAAERAMIAEMREAQEKAEAEQAAAEREARNARLARNRAQSAKEDITTTANGILEYVRDVLNHIGSEGMSWPVQQFEFFGEYAEAHLALAENPTKEECERISGWHAPKGAHVRNFIVEMDGWASDHDNRFVNEYREAGYYGPAFAHMTEERYHICRNNVFFEYED